MEEGKSYVVIDTDGGTDDALALMMMIEAHKHPDIPISIVGVVCVNGNTQVENVARNVTRVMLASNVNLPLYSGCQKSLIDCPASSKPSRHGLNGFGDANLPPVSPVVERKHGVTAIIDLAHKYKDCGKLTILALGPLTNLAMAIRMDPTIKDCIKEIYAMGGTRKAQGSITACAEHNFATDPEAAYITLNCYKCPIYITPLELCRKQPITQEWRREILGSVNTNQSILLNQIEEKILQENVESWKIADQLAAAALIEPLFARQYEGKKGKEVLIQKYCTVELHGSESRGLLVIDHNNYLRKSPNVTLIRQCDTNLLCKIMLWGVGGKFYK